MGAGVISTWLSAGRCLSRGCDFVSISTEMKREDYKEISCQNNKLQTAWFICDIVLTLRIFELTKKYVIHSIQFFTNS